MSVKYRRRKERELRYQKILEQKKTEAEKKQLRIKEVELAASLQKEKSADVQVDDEDGYVNIMGNKILIILIVLIKIQLVGRCSQLHKPLFVYQ